MPPQAVFNRGTRIAPEFARGSAPSTGMAASGWWHGGSWHNLITDEVPNFVDQEAVIFPQSFIGRRAMNQIPPVVGRKWSEGDISLPVVADALGLLLYGAVGDASTNALPNAAMLAATALAGSHNLTTQPHAGGRQEGRHIRFTIANQTDGGTISISGLDIDGNGASESISFRNNGFYYSRTAFSSIGNSGITINGVSGGSITVTAIDGYQHRFIPASGSSGITFSIESLGNPAAGAASRSFLHKGMVLKEMTMENDAAAPDGLFMISATFEGDPTATCNISSLSANQASPMRLWPGWTLEVRRDPANTPGNTTAWNKVTSYSLTINAGGRNFNSATGLQGPAGTFFGGYEVTGEMTLLIDDEVEFLRWQAASLMGIHAQWTSPWKLGSGSNMSLSASLNHLYLESFPAATDEDGAQSISLSFRTVDGADNPVRFLLTNATPGTAYSLTQA